MFLGVLKLIAYSADSANQTIVRGKWRHQDKAGKGRKITGTSQAWLNIHSESTVLSVQER